MLVEKRVEVRQDNKNVFVVYYDYAPCVDMPLRATDWSSRCEPFAHGHRTYGKASHQRGVRRHVAVLFTQNLPSFFGIVLALFWHCFAVVLPSFRRRFVVSSFRRCFAVDSPSFPCSAVLYAVISLLLPGICHFTCACCNGDCEVQTPSLKNLIDSNLAQVPRNRI